MTNKLLQAVLDAKRNLPSEDEWNNLSASNKIWALYGSKIINGGHISPDVCLSSLLEQAEEQCNVRDISNDCLTYQDVLRVYACAEKIAKMIAFI